MSSHQDVPAEREPNARSSRHKPFPELSIPPTDGSIDRNTSRAAPSSLTPIDPPPQHQSYYHDKQLPKGPCCDGRHHHPPPRSYMRCCCYSYRDTCSRYEQLHPSSCQECNSHLNHHSWPMCPASHGAGPHTKRQRLPYPNYVYRGVSPVPICPLQQRLQPPTPPPLLSQPRLQPQPPQPPPPVEYNRNRLSPPPVAGQKRPISTSGAASAPITTPSPRLAGPVVPPILGPRASQQQLPAVTAQPSSNTLHPTGNQQRPSDQEENELVTSNPQGSLPSEQPQEGSESSMQQAEESIFTKADQPPKQSSESSDGTPQRPEVADNPEPEPIPELEHEAELQSDESQSQQTAGATSPDNEHLTTSASEPPSSVTGVPAPPQSPTQQSPTSAAPIRPPPMREPFIDLDAVKELLLLKDNEELERFQKEGDTCERFEQLRIRASVAFEHACSDRELQLSQFRDALKELELRLPYWTAVEFFSYIDTKQSGRLTKPNFVMGIKIQVLDQLAKLRERTANLEQ